MIWNYAVASILAETPEQRDRRVAWWAGLSRWQRFKYRASEWRNLVVRYFWNLWQAICGLDDLSP